MPSLATLAGVARQPDEEQTNSLAVMPNNRQSVAQAPDDPSTVKGGIQAQGGSDLAGDITQGGTIGNNGDNVRYGTQVLPTNAGANSQAGSAVVPTGIGDILKNGLDSSNILGTVTPLATGLIGLLGNQQSTDALKKGAADATKTIQDGNANIQNLLKSVYGEQSDILKPYQAVGQQGLDGISAGLQPGGGLVDGYHGATEFTRDPNFTRNTDNADTGQFNRATDFTDPTKFSFTAADLAQDPGMKFRMDEQNKLLARRQASSGSLSSGAALKAAADYSGNLASQEYGNAYNRAEGTFNNNYGRASSQFGDNYNRASTQNQQNFQNNAQVFNENYSRANAQFADNYNRDATTFGSNFNRGLTEQQSNQQQKMSALMNAAGIGQNASNTLVGAKGAQGQQSATTQQLTNQQTADLQTSLASAIAAGDTTRANQISGIISGTLGAVQSASDAAKAQANQKPGDQTTINVQGGTGGTGTGGAGGTGGSVGDVSAETGDVSNTQGDQTNTQGDQTQTGDPNGEGKVIDIHGVDADGNPTIDISGNQTKGSGSTVGKVLTAANTGVGLLKNLLTKGNTSTVNGLADGSVSTAASSAAKSLMQSGDAGLSAVGGFLTNPITIGVGAALAGALLWKKSQAHPTATTFVNGFQQPFGEHLGKVVDGFDTALATGKLDKATAQGLYDQTKSFIDGFESDTAKFATEGGKNAKVAQQAKDTMTKNFGPNYDKILGKMQSEIANLPDPAGGGQVKAAVMPQTGVQRLAGIAQGGGQ